MALTDSISSFPQSTPLPPDTVAAAKVSPVAVQKALSDSVKDNVVSTAPIPHQASAYSALATDTTVRYYNPYAAELGAYANEASVAEEDSVDQAANYGIVLTPPPAPQELSLRQNENNGVSFILSGLFILFLIIALRFRNNIKYAFTMFRDLVETRTRQNVFNDTVKETSLMFLLNFMWVACAGVTGFCVFHYLYPQLWDGISRSIGMLWGMALAAVYALFMWWAYACIGWIFSDRQHALLWVKGYAASQALMTPAFFIIALIAICRPEAAQGVGVIAVTIFFLAKLVFIWKGYRIFFTQFSSWVLFLCYLCSLEIVPLILCYRCALLLGEDFA